MLDALSKEKPVSQKEAVSATEWFLSEDPDESTGDTHSIDINVGGVGEAEQWVVWRIRPIDEDELRRIQRETAAHRRRGGRAAQDDVAVDMLANLRVIVECSVDPDIKASAQRLGRDPVAQLRHKFRRKPGLITQIANEIMDLSGFDAGDIRESSFGKTDQRGGEAQLLFLAWRYGGNDPYRTYNGLDEDYRPLGHPEEAPRPPIFPSRVRHFVYGCGLVAIANEGKLAGAKQASRAGRG